MPALIALVEGWVGPKFAKPLLYAGLAVLILGLLWGAKCAYDKSVITKYDQQQQQRAAPATNQAATERAVETNAIATHEEDMHHAIAAAPDQPIAPTSHVHGCDQLRRAHRNLAACGGSSSGH